MNEIIDTEALLVDMAEVENITDPVMFNLRSIGLIRMAANAIRQLHERIETERRKLALAEERVNALLQEKDEKGLA